MRAGDYCDAVEETIYGKCFPSYGDNSDNYFSNNFNLPIKVGWDKEDHVICKRNNSGSEDTKPEYQYTMSKANCDYDMLKGATMLVKMPCIKVKKEYEDHIQIKLAPYVGYKIAGDCSFEGTVNNRTYNSQIVAFNKLFDREVASSVLSDMGMRTVCVNWTNRIKACELSYPQTWYYSWPSSCGYPLLKLKNDAVVTHRHKLCLNISELINARVWENGEWRIATKIEMEWLDVVSPMIPVPDLILRVKMLSDREKEDIRRNVSCEFPIYDIKTTVCKNPVGSSSKNSIDLESRGLYQAAFLYAARIDYLEANMIGNYTTNMEMEPDSISPIVCTELKTTELQEDVPSIPASISQAAGDGIFPGSRKKCRGILCHMFVTTFQNSNNGGCYPQGQKISLGYEMLPSKKKNIAFIVYCSSLVMQYIQFDSNGPVVLRDRNKPGTRRRYDEDSDRSLRDV